MIKLLLLISVVKARERFSPCPNSCSGHGLCDAWHVCHCADTYQGADCSQRTCPYGPAWADHPEQIRGTAWATSRRSALEEVIVTGWGGLVFAVSASRARLAKDERAVLYCAPEEVFVAV